jgi:hypothetical protein
MTEHQIGKGQNMVMQFQKLISALELGQLLHLIEGSQLPRPDAYPTPETLPK